MSHRHCPCIGEGCAGEIKPGAAVGKSRAATLCSFLPGKYFANQRVFSHVAYGAASLSIA